MPPPGSHIQIRLHVQRLALYYITLSLFTSVCTSLEDMGCSEILPYTTYTIAKIGACIYVWACAYAYAHENIQSHVVGGVLNIALLLYQK